MLDLGPEKLLALLVIGLVVLGPDRLPEVARTIGKGIHQARHLAATLTDPIRSGLEEPRRALDSAVDDVRSAVSAPLAEIRSDITAPTATAPTDPTWN